MATIAKESMRLATDTMKHRMFGIRHGEALHNIVGGVYGTKVYEKFGDTTLTVKGMQQALEASAPEVDVVLVSPLMRTLQTAAIMYPDTPMIALECLKEIPQHTEICNRRSSRSLLVRLFPKVDWSMITEEEQLWPEHISNALRKNQLQVFVKSIPQERVALVTHSSWLKYYTVGSVEPEPELKHCFPYKLAAAPLDAYF
jgi:hypothetical protein